jgi:RNA-directed DNA polymerase
MRELHIEGLATHDDPESCVGVRKGVCEALTGARAGRVLSPEISQSRVPTQLRAAEGHTHGGDNGKPSGDPAGSKTPRMRGISMRENREIPKTPSADGALGRIGKAMVTIR